MAKAGRGAQREEAILLATLQLLAESGYDQLTIDAVAARARCSKATIYRRWPGKAALVVTAVRRYAGPPELSALVWCPKPVHQGVPETRDQRHDLQALRYDPAIRRLRTP